MTLFFRLIQVGLYSLFQRRLTDFGEPHTMSFRVLPTDLDVFVHMNNAKYLNYMEAVRWGIVLRAGFFWKCLRRGWTLPIARIDVRFLRPLQLFQRFTVRAQIVGFSDRWIYIYQTFHSQEKMIGQAMVRTLILGPKGSIRPADLVESLGMSTALVHVPVEIRSWYEDFSREPHGRDPRPVA